MTKRGLVSIGFILVGVILMVWAYFFGAAPWCATGVECSDPQVEWSPGVFVLGVVVSFSSALYYSIARDRGE